MSRPTRAIRWSDLGLVFGVSLVVRLAYFWLNSRGNPAFDYLIMDSLHIDRWAKAIAAGDAGAGVYFRGPLYPYLLALVYQATGASVAAAVLLNHLAGALSCAAATFGLETLVRDLGCEAGSPVCAGAASCGTGTLGLILDSTGCSGVGGEEACVFLWVRTTASCESAGGSRSATRMSV